MPAKHLGTSARPWRGVGVLDRASPHHPDPFRCDSSLGTSPCTPLNASLGVVVIPSPFEQARRGCGHTEAPPIRHFRESRKLRGGGRWAMAGYVVPLAFTLTWYQSFPESFSSM